ncbi:radical SAM protein [Streptomyces formicae]|uniref:Radical S-adenosyl methionine domain containing 2 Pfam: Radical_SAM n=1 Tax=Streptomyces formicae TaxID=1616117 RepID=A0A291Q962_9ACTN|nr:radical SAM protein [Streptomyces formicae]ATL28025.1 radical S-adenosyl methionine domain containing 2 Pfam: Radical_SAM [Streptomyces formicae]
MRLPASVELPPVRLPAFVDLRPIGRCNLDCPFCFGPRHDVPSMDEETALRVASVLRDGGVRGVVISGGEPTLLPYLPDLVRELSAPLPDGRRPRVVLSTNGLAPLRAMERVLPGLSWIALPLESKDGAEHKLMRTGVAPHRDKVLGLLREVRKNHQHVRVKLGTVVTRLNTKGAPDVLDLIEDDGSLPHVWKVYQMSETNYGADNRDWLSIGDDEFEDVVARCQEAADRRGVPLRVYRNSTRTGSYFFVDPDCEVVVVDEGGERRTGNLFERLARGTLRPAELITPARNAENFDGTYPDA